jgi:hypothetical protein
MFDLWESLYHGVLATDGTGRDITLYHLTPTRMQEVAALTALFRGSILNLFLAEFVLYGPTSRLSHSYANMILDSIVLAL